MDRWGMTQLENNNLTVVDLFCGAGIGGIGVKLAGFNTILAIDNNKYAVDTYNKNIGNHAIYKDIRYVEEQDIPNHDIMVATPTCKSFSWAGAGEGFDHKEHGDLIYHFFRLLKGKMPKAFLFENVDGMVSKKHKPTFLEIVKDIEHLGYDVTWKVLNCYDYGVPQTRKRLFMVGILKNLGCKFTFPKESSSEDKTNIRYAIGDLPEPSKVVAPNGDILLVNTTTDANHIGYGLRKDEQSFINKVSIGGNWRDLSVDDAKLFLGGAFGNGGGNTGFLRKVSFDKPAHTITSTILGKNNSQIIDNQDKYMDCGMSPRYKSRNRQRQWGEPSFTVVSEARQLPLYPEPSNYDVREVNLEEYPPPRRFTVRECLRLQTVPDWFVFEDTIPLKKQYERCSGIPSLVAYKLMLAIKDTLDKTENI